MGDQTAADCLIGQYFNKTYNKCFCKNRLLISLECHKSCKTCNGPTKGHCTSCPSRMFVARTEHDGNLCVSNCESVGLYYDKINNLCVGCHPACSSCYGPNNYECLGCAEGML